MMEYTYIAKGGPYGVFITILGDISPLADCSEYEQITSNIAIKWMPGLAVKGEKFCEKDKQSIVQAIKRIEFDKSHLLDECIMICIYSIQYNYCDFQQEGLTVGMMYWCQRHLNANIGMIESRYDNVLQKYIFYHNGEIIHS